MMKTGLTVCLALALVGCNREPKTFNVSGTVNWDDGKPVEKGLIFFDPAPGTDGPQGSATIDGGRYTTATDSKKIAAGKYTARIEGYGGKAGNESPMGKLLFNDFQQEVDLPASDSEKNFEIPRGILKK